MANQYYRSCCAVLVVYDVSDRTSFEHLEYWLNKIDENAGLNIRKLLVASKCDLSYKRTVSRAEGEEFAKRNNLKYMETSSKIGKNVNTAFENLAFDVFWDINNKKVIADEDGSNGVKIGDLLSNIQNETLHGGSRILKKEGLQKKNQEDKKDACCN